MVAAIRSFDHSYKSYEKKYKVIYTKYKNDKRANKFFGLDRHQKYKWFKQLDIWNFTYTCVKNKILTCTMEGEDEKNEDKSLSKLQD